MNTTKKHRQFTAEPVGEKPVTDLAGIGEKLGDGLKDKGFDKAYKVLGQFLVLGKDEDKFKKWLEEICSANAKQQNDCFMCLSEWCDNFFR